MKTKTTPKNETAETLTKKTDETSNLTMTRMPRPKQRTTRAKTNTTTEAKKTTRKTKKARQTCCVCLGAEGGTGVHTPKFRTGLSRRGGYGGRGQMGSLDRSA